MILYNLRYRTLAEPYVKQLALTFSNMPDYRADAYVVSRCNTDVYQWLEAWPAWSNTIGALIIGEPFSGKTHLCHTFFEKFPHARMLSGKAYAHHHPFDLTESLFIIDDADKAPSEWLFHFFNHMRAKNGHIILTMTRPYHDWCQLPDLTSRLSTLATFTLSLPDDDMVLTLLKKNLNDRGVFTDEAVLVYLAQRIDRSYVTLNRCVRVLERLSAEQKRNITVAFVRGILTDLC